MRNLNISITVGTDPVVILINRAGLNSRRRAYIITNISTGGQIISVSVGEQAVANKGTVLNVGGSVDRNPDQSPQQEEFTAVASAAGGILAIYEESE